MHLGHSISAKGSEGLFMQTTEQIYCYHGDFVFFLSMLSVGVEWSDYQVLDQLKCLEFCMNKL